MTLNARGQDRWIMMTKWDSAPYALITGRVSDGRGEDITNQLATKFRRTSLSGDAETFVLQDGLEVLLCVRQSGEFALAAFIDEPLDKSLDFVEAARSHMERIFEEFRLGVRALQQAANGASLLGLRFILQDPVTSGN